MHLHHSIHLTPSRLICSGNPWPFFPADMASQQGSGYAVLMYITQTREDEAVEAHANRDEEHCDTPTPAAEGALLCPVCNGIVIPLRDSYRCVRCRYSFCVGCDGAALAAGD
jgi:hypothetical protein